MKKLIPRIKSFYLGLSYVWVIAKTMNQKIGTWEESHWMGNLRKFTNQNPSWTEKSFEIWTAVRVGGLINGSTPTSEYLEVCVSGHIHKKSEGDVISMVLLPGFKIEEKARLINLIVIQVRELGFKENSVSYEKILKQAENFGLTPCPKETALRLAYQDDCLLGLKEITTHTVVSEPIEHVKHEEKVFSLFTISTKVRGEARETQVGSTSLYHDRCFNSSDSLIFWQ